VTTLRFTPEQRAQFAAADDDETYRLIILEAIHDADGAAARIPQPVREWLRALDLDAVIHAWETVHDG
jgi:hypothetical protein